MPAKKLVYEAMVERGKLRIIRQLRKTEGKIAADAEKRFAKAEAQQFVEEKAVRERKSRKKKARQLEDIVAAAAGST